MYRVLNPEGFSNALRREVVRAAGLGDEDQDHVTNIQVLNLLESKCILEDGEYLATDEIVSEITKEAQCILLGVMLSKMAAAGEIESAWDEEKGEAVFWLPGEGFMIDELEYVGKTVDDARNIALAKGLSVRITMVDEVETMSTSELRRDRVNFKISGGLVTGAYPG